MKAVTSKLNEPKEVINSFKEVSKDHVLYLENMLADGTILENKEIDAFVQTIYQNLLKGNTSIRSDLRILVSRSAEPNAFSMGEGTIVLNLNLISRMKTEAQVAFVLAHEIAHQQLAHIINGYLAQIKRRTSKNFKAQLETIKKIKYGKQDLLDQLSLNIGLSTMFHSRNKEKQADSLGIIILANSCYDATEALNALTVLDTVDQPVYVGKLNLAEIFSTPQQPYNPNWQNYDYSNSWKIAKSLKEQQLIDSLKSHPDCKLRAENVKKLLTSIGYRKKGNCLPQPNLASIQELGLMELPGFYIEQGRPDLALYHAYFLSKKHPQNAYFGTLMSLSFNIIAYAMKNHKLGTYSPSPNKDRYHTAINEILELIHSISYSEFKPIAQKIYQENASKTKSTPSDYALANDVLAAFIEVNKAKPNYTALHQACNTYLTTFPMGRFANQVKAFKNIK